MSKQAELLRQAREREAREASEAGARSISRFERTMETAGKSPPSMAVSPLATSLSSGSPGTRGTPPTSSQHLYSGPETTETSSSSTPISPRHSPASSSSTVGRYSTTRVASNTADGGKKLNSASSGSSTLDSATATTRSSSDFSLSKRPSRASNTLSSSDPEDSDEVPARKKDTSSAARSKMTSVKEDDSVDALGSSQADDETPVSPNRRSKHQKSPATPPKTPRSPHGDQVTNLGPLGLHYSAPSIPSPTRTKGRRNLEMEDEASGSATIGSSSLENSSASGDGVRMLDSPQFQTDLDTFFEDDDGEMMHVWKEQDTSAHAMALQVLKTCGLAVSGPFPSSSSRTSNRSPSGGPSGRVSNLSQSDIISSGPRAHSWAHSTSRPKTARPRPLRRQIVMLDGEAPPKASSTTNINAAKISHLTIDHLIHLIADTQLSQDKSFLDTLILAHDYFIKSPDLLAVLIHIYRSSQVIDANKIQADTSASNSSLPPLSPRQLSAAATGGAATAGTSASSSSAMQTTASMTPESPKSMDSDEDSSVSIRESISPSITESASEANDGSTTPTSGAMPTLNVPAARLKTRDRSISEFLDAASAASNVSGSTAALMGSNATASPANEEDLGNSLKRMRTINILKKVIESRFYILRRSPIFANLLQRFVVELLTSADDREKRFGEVLRTAMKTNAAFVREDDAEAPAPAPVLQEKYSSSNITSIRYKSASARKSLDDYSPVEIARQITLIDFENWNSIPLSELAHAAFNAKDATTRCPRITKCTNRFNELAQWVSSTVVLAAKKKHRIAVLSKFLQVMDELRSLKNFHALMAFYSALNQAAILRLKKTWKGVSNRVTVIWNGINKFFDNSQDFKVYREFVKSADPPCIPYIGFILGGLTFVEEFPTFIVEDSQGSESSEQGDRPARPRKKRSSTKSTKSRSEVVGERSKSSILAGQGSSSASVVSSGGGGGGGGGRSGSAERSGSSERSGSGAAAGSAEPKERPPPSHASPERERAASLRLQSYRVKTPNMSRLRDQGLTDSTCADTEGTDQESSNNRLSGKFRHLELDNSAATSSDFTDIPSPHGSAVSSPRLSRRSSNPNFGGASAEATSNTESSDPEDTLSSEDDDSKLRRVLREPIPQTVEPNATSKRTPGSGGLSQSAIVPSSTVSGGGVSSGSNPGSPQKLSASSNSTASPRARRTRPVARNGNSHNEPLPHGQQFLNWRKMVMLSRAFADVLRFQRTRYDLVVVREIEKFVSELRQHSWFLDEQELAAMSQEIEPDPSDSGSSSSSSVRDTLSQVKESIAAVLPSPDGKKKDKGKKEKNKARPTFEALSTDPILFSEFRKFLIAQYSHENLLFWEAVNKFKQVDLAQPHNKVKAMAQEIFGRFISGTVDNGSFTIGFSHDIKETITKKINTNDYEPAMFDSALQEVEHSLLKPSFGQFLNETQ